MDDPQLNLIFGLVVIFTLFFSLAARLLLSRTKLPGWLRGLSWAALILNLISALYIEILFLRLMTSAFNWQIVLGLIVIGAIGALFTAIFYRREIPPQTASFPAGVQVLISLAGVRVAYGLSRSLVPA
jgi:hypothetical protein